MKILILALWAVLSGAPAFAVCSNDSLSLRGEFGKVSFQVVIADSVQSRARGLMFVEALPKFSGMLFVYARPQAVAFWMKNTLIPLDMIFMDEHGTVMRVHDSAVPGDLTPIDGGAGIMAVLEVNGGLADQLGIAVGAQVKHPAFNGTGAVWPCE